MSQQNHQKITDIENQLIMKIAFTGHRPPKLGNDYDLTFPLCLWIDDKIAKLLCTLMPEMCYIGMALGVDTIAAKRCILNEFPFTAAIPCKDQDRMWPKESQHLYKYLINHPLCTKHYISELPYTHSCMQERNIWMVDQLIHPEDRLIAIWDGSSGGTANCVEYAKQRFTKENIITINPFDYEKEH